MDIPLKTTIHRFYWGFLLLTIQLLGYPHYYGNPHCQMASLPDTKRPLTSIQATWPRFARFAGVDFVVTKKHGIRRKKGDMR